MTKEQKERHDWCERKAREFFANKNRKKWYHTCYKNYDCDAEYEWYEPLPDSFVEDIKAAFDRFVSENALSSVKDIEPDWREEIIYQLDPANYGIEKDPFYGNPQMIDVDFDDYMYLYEVRGTINDTRFDMLVPNGVSHIKVDDEDYIQVLTELLYASSELSFDDLYGIIPQTCEVIKQSCERSNVVDDIVLAEMNRDAQTILKW